MTQKEEKFFCGDRWYHGTTLGGWKSICKLGILADYNIGNSLDFGNGFYLSNNIVNTRKYVRNITQNSISREIDDITPVIVCFQFMPIIWIEQGLSYRYFEKYDDKFAEFVFQNRLHDKEKKKHAYDITAGVTSDAKPAWLMQQYLMDRVSKEDVIQELKRDTSVKQLCLHQQEQCDLIVPDRVFIPDRKELNIYDYCNER